MAIIGTHAVLYTPDADAVRAFFRDVLELDHVDAGGGWLIFKLPPAEVGVHPGEDASHHLSLMCDDLEATMAELTAKGVTFKGEPVNAGFGITTTMQLPGEVEIQLYQPRHDTAI